jgi:hypothetical protein
MDEIEVNIGGNGTTYAAILYGESTDYTAEVCGVGGDADLVRPWNPPDDCSVAVTNMERARSLPDLTSPDSRKV